MKALKKTISIALSLAMCASLVAPSFAAVEYDIANGNVYIGTDENGKTVSWQNEDRKWDKDDKWKDGERKTDSEIIIKQGETQYGFTQNTVTVLGGVQGAAVTLDNVNIKGGFMYGDSTGAAFNIESGSSVDVTLKGSNRLVSGEESAMAGLDVAGGSSVTINGTGSDSLYAEGGKRAAGIGGGSFQKGGDVTINGGDITAVGGSASTLSTDKRQAQAGGAGIGSGGNGSAGNITINGGNVTAQGGSGVQVDSYGSPIGNVGGGAGIGTGHKGTAGQIKVSSGNVTAKANSTGAGIGTGNLGTVTGIEISKGLVTAEGGKGGAGIGTGYLGTVQNEIKISGDETRVEATGGEQGAGIGSGTSGTVNTVKISGGDVTGTGGAYGAGIGSGYLGTVNTVEISSADVTKVTEVTATGGDYAAAIGAGYEGKFTAISISGGDIVAQSGLWASAIGNGSDAQGGQAIGGTIAIQGVNSLIALGDYWFAVDSRSYAADVNQTILNGRFLEEIGVDSSNGLNKVEEVEFVIVNAEGAEIKRFTLKPQGTNNMNMYDSFAVNLPEGGTYYVFPANGNNYGGSAAGYENSSFEPDANYQGKKIVYAISENDMLNANLMQFPSFDVSYRFVSDTEGRELPASIAAPSRESGRSMTLAQLNRVIAGNGTYTDIRAGGGTWHFEGWEPGKSAVNGGVLTDVELVGKWSFTAGPASPGSNPTNPAANPTVEIGDVDVPLAGIFTRADAIGYLWEQTGSPEWELSDFPDVPEDHEWAAAIGWAQDMGIAVADEDGNFRPDDPVLRSVEDLEVDPEGELQEFLNRYAVFAGIVLEPDELFIELAGEPDDVIMGEEAQAIFDGFFAKLEAALAHAA